MKLWTMRYFMGFISLIYMLVLSLPITQKEERKNKLPTKSVSGVSKRGVKEVKRAYGDAANMESAEVEVVEVVEVVAVKVVAPPH